jgi:hypothetical protein
MAMDDTSTGIGPIILSLLSGVASAYNPGVARGVNGIYSALDFLEQSKDKRRIRQQLAERDSANENLQKTALAVLGGPNQNANPDAQPLPGDKGTPTVPPDVIANATPSSTGGGSFGGGDAVHGFSPLTGQPRLRSLIGGNAPEPKPVPSIPAAGKIPSKLIGVPMQGGDMTPEMKAYFAAEAKVSPEQMMKDLFAYRSQSQQPQLPTEDDFFNNIGSHVPVGGSIHGAPRKGGGTLDYSAPAPDKPEKPEKASIEVKTFDDGNGGYHILTLRDGKPDPNTPEIVKRVRPQKDPNAQPTFDKPLTKYEVARLRGNAANEIGKQPDHLDTPVSGEEVDGYMKDVYGIDPSTGQPVGAAGGAGGPEPIYARPKSGKGPRKVSYDNGKTWSNAK